MCHDKLALRFKTVCIKHYCITIAIKKSTHLNTIDSNNNNYKASTHQKVVISMPDKYQTLVFDQAPHRNSKQRNFDHIEFPCQFQRFLANLSSIVSMEEEMTKKGDLTENTLEGLLAFQKNGATHNLSYTKKGPRKLQYQRKKINTSC